MGPPGGKSTGPGAKGYHARFSKNFNESFKTPSGPRRGYQKTIVDIGPVLKNKKDYKSGKKVSG